MLELLVLLIAGFAVLTNADDLLEVSVDLLASPKTGCPRRRNGREAPGKYRIGARDTEMTPHQLCALSSSGSAATKMLCLRCARMDRSTPITLAVDLHLPMPSNERLLNYARIVPAYHRRRLPKQSRPSGVI
jgi:hypothetical protein